MKSENKIKILSIAIIACDVAIAALASALMYMNGKNAVEGIIEYKKFVKNCCKN